MLKRTFLGIGIRDKSVEAVEFYQKAFDAKLVNSVKNDEGGYIHAELDVYGQIITVGEAWPKDKELITGTIMQYNLHFTRGSENIIRKIYDVLKEDANVHTPIGECFFSPLMFGLVDRYGVDWCVFCSK